MLVKNILAAFTIAGLATASPLAELEARSNTCSAGDKNAWCCGTAARFSIFFIRAAGQNCVPAGPSGGPYVCPSTNSYFLCCNQGQVVDGTSVVCTS